jgi:pyroglutamyl-peptidase
MKVLFTAFDGENNSSKLLLDKINYKHKLCLRNDFARSARRLERELKSNDFDLVISFGQAPLPKDTIKIETVGRGEQNYKTNYDYSLLAKALSSDFNLKISENAGKYLCNHLYYCGLKYINDNNLKTKMVFIHIPMKEKIGDLETLAKTFMDIANYTK